ncbi:MAG: pentapeptide repeat-containing protein [Ardenticatenaceae bacterium]|nr:pentapeptide repeat-containing protein [Ardenticatenaceae bacterium]MCB9443131.1 pentapeptide repeat-containing protein [Ardenticatenaceae bacterium]
MNEPFESGEEYYDREFTGLEWARGKLKAVTFDNCIFKACLFSETQFQRCTFRDCEFQDCDLSLIDVEYCAVQRTKFQGCKLAGVNWAKVERIQWPAFHDCNLSYNTFMGLDLERAVITGCVAKEAYFDECNLTDANCTGTDFSNGRFFHTNLTRVDFTDARNYFIAPHLNTLKKTKFAMPEALALLHGLDIILDDNT